MIISSLSFFLNCRLCWWNNKSRPLWAALFSDNLRTIIYDNTIRDVDNSLKDQLKRFRDKNVKSEENSSSGSLGLESEMGLKIIFRTKLMLQTCGYHETDSIEIWDEGAAGKRIKKVAQGPKFYKGTFTIDSQILDGEPQILSFETIAAIFGWTEYLELAKQRVTTDKVEKHK